LWAAGPCDDHDDCIRESATDAESHADTNTDAVEECDASVCGVVCVYEDARDVANEDFYGNGEVLDDPSIR
jgi:hypothetical protein